MKHLRNMRRAVLLLAASVLLLAVSAVAAAAVTGGGATGAAAATGGTGKAASGSAWIRLAHLSPNTPAVDVYLYSFGNPNARTVLHHVAYGDVSGYLAVPGGDYNVAMRPAGAPATSQPVLSSTTRVTSGTAYTVLAVGPRPGLRLRIFHDDLTTPPGKSLVRVVQASMKHPHVTVSWGGQTIASRLPFASVTSYQAVAPGVETLTVTGDTGDTETAVTFTADSIHTLIVLDGAKGLQVAYLEDANGSSRLPAGGVQTGFGGAAPHGPGSPLPWLEVIAAGSVLTLGGGLGLRRRLSVDGSLGLRRRHGLRGGRRKTSPRHARPSWA